MARDAAGWFSKISAVVSLGALAGWALGYPFLAQGFLDSEPLSPVLALGFLLLAIAIHNHFREPLNVRAKIFLVLTSCLAPLLVWVDGGFFGLSILPTGLTNGWLGFRGLNSNPYALANLSFLSLVTALSPLFHQRRFWGDALGALVLCLLVINSVFIFGYAHKTPVTLFGNDQRSAPFLACVNMLLLSFAVLGRLGPRNFPLRFLSGPSVRAVLLRHFFLVAGASALIFDVLNVASYGRIHLVPASFLFFLISLVVVVYMSLRSAEVIGRHIENSVKESEHRYAVLVNSLKDHAVVMLDAEGSILTWNSGAERIHGYGVEEILGEPVSRFYLERERESGHMRIVFLEAVRNGTHEEQGWRVRKDGTAFWAEIVTTPFIDDKKNVLGFSQVLRDITLRKKDQDSLKASLRGKEAMLKEIHHRVKNNLQMISSLLRLQSEKIQDPDLSSLFLESQTRVRSMALIHECLYQSPDLAHMDFSEYVEKLTEGLLRTYRVHPEKNTLRLEVDKAPLSLDVAIPCGLIITELVSNALKHAYPQAGEGVVSIRFRALPEKNYELVVSDEGVGFKRPVDFASTETLGLRLVYILTEQLKGQISIENDGGAKVIIRFRDPTG